MKDSCSLVFTGDIGFDKYMDGQWNDPELISQDVLDYLHSADHVVANVEGALISRKTLARAVQNSGRELDAGALKLLHSMDPAAAGVLDRMHADIWNLCNNHIMDAGEAGVGATLAEARLHGARTIGAGMNIDDASRPLILDGAGGIGLFSCGYRRGCKPAAEDHAGCLLWNDMDRIQANIDAIKRECRWCVMVVHGGEEFTSLPSPYVRDRYRRFLEMGADIIVAHHPHVPMNYELFPGSKAIFYSLGNFIFDTDYQRAQFNTDRGVLVRLHFTKDSWQFDALGLQIQRGPEHVTAAPLPAIFTNVPDKEYQLLEPLSAEAFVAATKRQQIYLKPAEYTNADAAKWHENFWNPRRSGRVPGEALDFQIICPIADQAADGAWKRSRLPQVVQYILSQL